MSTDCLVGVLDPDQPDTVRVRYVHFDGAPGYILPALDRIWSSTCSHDTTALVDGLLAHQWSYLGGDVAADTAITFTGEQPVPGIGMASEFDADSQVEVLPMPAAVDRVRWVYLIDPEHATVTVHESGNLDRPPTRHHLTAPGQQASSIEETRPVDLVAAARGAGGTHGRSLADTWAHDALDGARAQAQVTALRVLTADPSVPQAPPGAGPAPELGISAPAELAGVLGSPVWSRLTPTRRSEILDAWRAAAHDAFADRVVEHCRNLLGAAGGAGRDLSHLRPDRLRIGGVGVFAGDWAATPGPSGQMRLPVGFVGVLTGTWNGFAVFTCSRAVAEAIVADQQVQRERHRARLIDLGRGPDDADRDLDEAMATMRFDRDTIVVDETAATGDPDAVTRIGPDPDGRYVVMGGSWTWQAVDPHDCDTIIGDLPAPGAQQRFVELPHTGLRAPHDRLHVTDLQTVAGTPPTSLVTLALDDTPVAEARTSADGAHLSLPSATFSRGDWAAYLTGCRQHGRPASQTQVLDALVTEYQVGQAARQAAADGAVLTRLLDADGTILLLRPVWPAPRDHLARRRLGQRLRLRDPHPRGHLWQWWTGTAWHHLASVTGSRTVADPTGRRPNLGQLLAFLIAGSLYESLDRDQLVRQAADDGIPLDRQMSDDQIRALVRDAHRERGREAGLPVDDLPTLTAADGLELGRIATGGAPTNHPATTDQPTPSDPDQPPTHR
ncbi:hypothetical protein O7627_33455 [Solwaraspora sp. WMMD1047]|uniref:hypothetical protein n=1 Tax=Solwaraspora sp. WMMD1047 TaxID=3016102 RepID=UPI00241719CB|nr:hypothetical protein [Solwaraspora sp. WMMD1047]MDG4834174.1 hypothetical protein [Solwaraspora sp. WMMD1047]